MEANRKIVEQHGIRGAVLRQEQMEVASQYRAQGTPMGYRIDAAGRIASELTIGGEALLQLAGRAPHPDKRGPAGKGSSYEGRTSCSAWPSGALFTRHASRVLVDSAGATSSAVSGRRATRTIWDSQPGDGYQHVEFRTPAG